MSFLNLGAKGLKRERSQCKTYSSGHEGHWALMELRFHQCPTTPISSGFPRSCMKIRYPGKHGKPRFLRSIHINTFNSLLVIRKLNTVRHWISRQVHQRQRCFEKKKNPTVWRSVFMAFSLRYSQASTGTYHEPHICEINGPHILQVVYIPIWDDFMLLDTIPCVDKVPYLSFHVVIATRLGRHKAPKRVPWFFVAGNTIRRAALPVPATKRGDEH